MDLYTYVTLHSTIAELVDEAIENTDGDVTTPLLNKARDRGYHSPPDYKIIKLAEQSEHGWATVGEYEQNELAEDES